MEQGAIRKRKNRDFRVAWLDEDYFKGWLAPHPTEDKAICLLCNTSIRCVKTDLMRHSQTGKHIEKISCQSLDNRNLNNSNNINNNKKTQN